jgi:hypothetical protein
MVVLMVVPHLASPSLWEKATKHHNLRISLIPLILTGVATLKVEVKRFT